WEVTTGREVQQLRGHENDFDLSRFPNLSHAFSADSRLLFSVSGKGLLAWEISTGKMLRHFRGTPEQVNQLACSRDGKLLASAGGDGHVRLWDIASGKELRRLDGHKDEAAWAVTFSRDGKWLASSGGDGTVRV